MNKQAQIQNLQVLIQLWEYSILTSQKDIKKAKKIIYQLEEQIEKLREANHMDDNLL